jgi:hypothetical protein
MRVALHEGRTVKVVSHDVRGSVAAHDGTSVAFAVTKPRRTVQP